MFDQLVTEAIKKNQLELLSFISNKFSEDETMSLDNLKSMFLDKIKVKTTNDKFEITRGRGRPKKN